MTKPRIDRVMVALDSTKQSQAALKAAAELAARLNVELIGLFVEDINLLQLASLPFAREIVYGSETKRSFSSGRYGTRIEDPSRAASQESGTYSIARPSSLFFPCQPWNGSGGTAFNCK